MENKNRDEHRQDFLYRGVLRSLKARFAYALTTRTVTDAVLAHDCDPPAAHVLGRALNAVALSIPFLKGDQRMTVRWQYQGALRTVIVDAGVDGDLRGLINPPQLLERADDKAALYGDACQVSLVRSTADRIVSSGTSECVLKDVVADLEFFYCTSDQIETGMLSMIGFQPDPKHPVHLSQGLLLQAMPECDLEQFEAVRRRLNHPDVRQLLSVPPSDESGFNLLLAAVLGDPASADDVLVDAGPAPHFLCHCDKNSLAAVAQTLSREDRRQILAADEELKITCSFCNRIHLLSPAALQEMFDEDYDRAEEG